MPRRTGWPWLLRLTAAAELRVGRDGRAGAQDHGIVEFVEPVLAGVDDDLGALAGSGLDLGRRVASRHRSSVARCDPHHLLRSGRFCSWRPRPVRARSTTTHPAIDQERRRRSVETAHPEQVDVLDRRRRHLRYRCRLLPAEEHPGRQLRHPGGPRRRPAAPGICSAIPDSRSDSDLHTFGYEFKPWRDEHAIASADKILAYLRETVAENGIDRQHPVPPQGARRGLDSAADARWTRRHRARGHR